MAIVIPEMRLAVIAYLCVLGSCSCSNGTVQGIIGEAVRLSCMSKSCGSKQWINDSQSETSSFIEPSVRTTVNSNGDTIELNIFHMGAYDVGSYSCLCNENSHIPSIICSDSLELVCQAEVVVNNISTLHNDSRIGSSPKVTINANVADRLKVKCADGAVSSTNCYKVMIRESGQFTYSFKVLSRHHNCTITCQTKKKDHVICSINFKVKVSQNEVSNHSSAVSTTVSTVSPLVNEKDFTTVSYKNVTLASANTTMKVDDKKDNNVTSATDKPISFHVIIVVCILVFIVLIVTLVASFCIFSLHSKSRSQSTQNANKVIPPTDANIHIHTTYATGNETSNDLVKGDGRAIESGAVGTDGFYFEIGRAGKEDSSTHQPNSKRAKTSITNEYYSEVNISDAKPKTKENEQETDITLYAEVNQGENQTRQKGFTSSPQRSADETSVSNVLIYHVLEETNRYDKDAECNVSTSQVLYAVVDEDT